MRGYTLLQITVVLLVLGATMLTAVPGLVRQVDRFACVAAREELAGLIDRARSEATLRGRAELVLEADSAVVWIESGGARLNRTDLNARYGVTTWLSSSATTIRIPFDRLGLGRFASGTVHLERGRGAAALVVSSYGRVRRQ